MMKIDALIKHAEGRVTIKDRETGEVLVEKMNAIHAENLSEAIALSLANRPDGHIHEMAFGNGASTVNGIGAVTYLPPNAVGSQARLHNETYSKVVNDQSPLNPNREENFIRVQHGVGNTYSDIIITCLLGFNEPSGQESFDDANEMETNFVFDELGIRSFATDPANAKMLTHVIFHPVQKSLNRSIEIVYTIRIYMA